MHPEPAKTQEEYIRNAYHYRGMFIDKFCFLEVEIERYLGRSFLTVPSEINHFKFIILDRLSFESKRTALRALLKEHFPDSTHKNLLDEIKRLNDKRNHFAHYYLALDKIGTVSDNVIMLTEYRDGIDVIIYDIERFDRAISRIQYVINEIKKLRKERFSAVS